MTTIQQLIRNKRKKIKKRSKSFALHKCPQVRARCDKFYVVNPKKPNSAKRKVARLTLSSGVKTVAYVPGEGLGIQENAVVLIRGGRVRDLPGVRYKVIPGGRDCGYVKNRKQSRSKYGVKKDKF